MNPLPFIKPLTGILRLREIILMTGFSFIGVFFSEGKLWTNANKMTLVSAAILCYVVAVYFLNSYADYYGDIKSDRLKKVSKVSRRNYLVLLVLFSCLFAALMLAINYVVLGLSLLSLGVWFLYYVPPFRLKESFFAGTCIHFIAGMLHFHTGYCSFNQASFSSVSISAFFALLLSLGHFHHEILDYNNDALAGHKTTAVRIGVKAMYKLRTVLSFFALVYWACIFALGYINTLTFMIFALSTLVLSVCSFSLQKQEQNKLFQTLSRGIFLLAGVMFIASRTVA